MPNGSDNRDHEQLLETWRIHDRIHRYLLDAISDEALAGHLTGGKGRSVGEILAHVHNVRLMWLKAADPALLDGLAKVEPAGAMDRSLLERSLTASGEAIGRLLAAGFAGGRIKGFKPHPAAFLGNLIAHESHHRGEIEVTLTQAGHQLAKKASFGLWEWGVR